MDSWFVVGGGVKGLEMSTPNCPEVAASHAMHKLILWELLSTRLSRNEFPNNNRYLRSWFLGGGFGQQLFNFRSPAVHWMARTSSLNCLSCRNPYQTPHSLNPFPLFTENPLFFTEKCFVGSPAQKSAQISDLKSFWGAMVAIGLACYRSAEPTFCRISALFGMFFGRFAGKASISLAQTPKKPINFGVRPFAAILGRKFAVD